MRACPLPAQRAGAAPMRQPVLLAALQARLQSLFSPLQEGDSQFPPDSALIWHTACSLSSLGGHTE